MVASFLENPKETHLTAVKRIFKYLRGTTDYGLWYGYKGYFLPSFYIDDDWARNVDDMKSTNSGAFFLGERLVAWTSKKHNYISQSNVEAEYVVVAINLTRVVWIKKLLEGIQEKMTEPIVIHFDNTRVIKIYKNLVMHSKNKHISIKYHFLREQVQEKQVRLEYIPIREHISYIFTKPLPKSTLR